MTEKIRDILPDICAEFLLSAASPEGIELVSKRETTHVHRKVNIIDRSEVALEKALAAKLDELLRSVQWLSGWQVKSAREGEKSGCDLWATLPLPSGGKADLSVWLKRELRPSHFRMLADMKISPANPAETVVPMLGTSWVSPRLAALCAEHGWSWFDLAGNYRLDVPGFLYLHHTGNAPVHRQPRPTANLRSPEAGRVIRALLSPENTGIRWTQRSVRDHFQKSESPIPAPSLGLVNKVVGYLRDESFIELSEDGGFRLRDPAGLFFAWRDVYQFKRQQRLGYFTLLQGIKLRDALVSFGGHHEGGVAYAAFSAAEFQAPHVRQPKTWLYVREDLLPEFEEALEAKLTDTGENLVVLIPSDEAVLYQSESGATGERAVRCTSLVQTYVDLFHFGGRGKEAAEALFNQRLKPEWKSRGLNV
jgi:hypothetical protein